MIYAFLQSCFGIGCLTSVIIILIVNRVREFRLQKKVELLQYMIDKDYETDKIDINNI